MEKLGKLPCLMNFTENCANFTVHGITDHKMAIRETATNSVLPLASNNVDIALIKRYRT